MSLLENQERDVVVSGGEREERFDRGPDAVCDVVGGVCTACRLGDESGPLRLVEVVRGRDVGRPVGVEHHDVTGGQYRTAVSMSGISGSEVGSRLR